MQSVRTDPGCRIPGAHVTVNHIFTKPPSLVAYNAPCSCIPNPLCLIHVSSYLMATIVSGEDFLYNHLLSYIPHFISVSCTKRNIPLTNVKKTPQHRLSRPSQQTMRFHLPPLDTIMRYLLLIIVCQPRNMFSLNSSTCISRSLIQSGDIIRNDILLFLLVYEGRKAISDLLIYWIEAVCTSPGEGKTEPALSRLGVHGLQLCF